MSGALIEQRAVGTEDGVTSPGTLSVPTKSWVCAVIAAPIASAFHPASLQKPQGKWVCESPFLLGMNVCPFHFLLPHPLTLPFTLPFSLLFPFPFPQISPFPFPPFPSPFFSLFLSPFFFPSYTSTGKKRNLKSSNTDYLFFFTGCF